jgi:hypothetical protein
VREALTADEWKGTGNGNGGSDTGRYRGWVCDGNYHHIINEPLLQSLHCDMIIWLNYSSIVYFCRLITRAWRQFAQKRTNVIIRVLAVFVAICTAPLLLANQYRLNHNRRRVYQRDIRQALATAATASSSSSSTLPKVIVFNTPAECEAYSQQVIGKLLNSYLTMYLCLSLLIMMLMRTH